MIVFRRYSHFISKNYYRTVCNTQNTHTHIVLTIRKSLFNLCYHCCCCCYCRNPNSFFIQLLKIEFGCGLCWASSSHLLTWGKFIALQITLLNLNALTIARNSGIFDTLCTLVTIAPFTFSALTPKTAENLKAS